MSLTETVVTGTLRPDGTLELDEKPHLPAGRVTVVLRRQSIVMLPQDDPFWQRMQAMWAAQNSEGHLSRSHEEIERFQRELRDEWEEREQAIERLQEHCREAQQRSEEPEP